MATKYTTADGTRPTNTDKLDMLFKEISDIIGCSESCQTRCVYPDVGEQVGCPLNQFRASVDYVFGVKEQ